MFILAAVNRRIMVLNRATPEIQCPWFALNECAFSLSNGWFHPFSVFEGLKQELKRTTLKIRIRFCTVAFVRSFLLNIEL